MQGIRKFIKDSITEFMKIEWPTLKDITILTLLVTILCFIMSVYLGMFDFGVTKLLSKINII